LSSGLYVISPGMRKTRPGFFSLRFMVLKKCCHGILALGNKLDFPYVNI
jgi:hypothetical protein